MILAIMHNDEVFIDSVDHILRGIGIAGIININKDNLIDSQNFKKVTDSYKRLIIASIDSANMILVKKTIDKIKNKMNLIRKNGEIRVFSYEEFIDMSLGSDLCVLGGVK